MDRHTQDLFDNLEKRIRRLEDMVFPFGPREEPEPDVTGPARSVVIDCDAVRGEVEVKVGDDGGLKIRNFGPEPKPAPGGEECTDTVAGEMERTGCDPQTAFLAVRCADLREENARLRGEVERWKGANRAAERAAASIDQHRCALLEEVERLRLERARAADGEATGQE